ncbi:MAG TPA: prepilin peptidase [Scandinavium sp.]|jgi:prepilin signal peptidase PulO-like enzyme (type II secretory pathway)
MSVLWFCAPWPFALPAFCIFLLVLWYFAQRLALDIFVVTGIQVQPQAATQALWVMIFSAVMTLCVMSPATTWLQCSALLFCVFIFRLSLSDVLTGFLPRVMTVSCLLAGLCFAAGCAAFVRHLEAAALIASLLWVLRATGRRFASREMLGLGDVWMGSALGGWLGWPALYAVLSGGALFAVWSILAGRTENGGPLGPWLGGGAIGVLLNMLYQPVLMW